MLLSSCGGNDVKACSLADTCLLIAAHTYVLFTGFCRMQIYHMRETHDELSHLLGPEEAAALGAREVFLPMAHLPPLQVWAQC